MRRQMLLLASVAVVVAFAGCHHCCKKDGCCPGPPPPYGRGPATLPPTTLPTQPAVPGAAPSVFPPPSGYLQAPVNPMTKGNGPEVLFGDPLPGGMSRPAQSGAQGVLGGPVKSATAEPPKALAVGTGLPGFTKVKDGLYAGRKPTIDGYDSLKNSAFRTVIYLHGRGADVAAVKDLATDRSLNFIAIETTPETLADASKQFDRVVGDRLTRPAYVFADDDLRAGAVWYLHFRNVDATGPDVARLKAKPLGLSERGEEGKAFELAINRVLEK